MRAVLTLLSVMAAALAVCALPAAARAYVVDRVEAVVDGEVITRSEVGRAVGLEAMRRGVTAGARMEELREEVLGALIDRKLLLAEARKFNIVEVTEEEISRAVASVRARFDTEERFQAALAEDEMTLEELREEMKDQLIAVKYVDRRVRFFVRVTLDEQRSYYERNRDSFGGREFGEVHEEIYEILLEQKTNEKLDEYLAELRSRARIEVLHAEEPR